MNICLIPARSGSKRIRNKNIKNFFGKPILAYTIQIALKCKLFDRVIVSTDSKKYSTLAKKYGAEVYFRTKKLSSDMASDLSVIKDFLRYCKKNKSRIYILCYLYPINPLLKISTLLKCFKKIKKRNINKLITLKRYTYPIQRSYIYKRKQFLVWDRKSFIKRSQDLKNFYHDAAQCYWYKVKKNFNLYEKSSLKTHGIILKTFESHDVDEPEDFETLKKIYKYNLHK
tara:strand:- start:1132 stop:1815 length:684 start_codon:yes stop_codon:yes gene_type:complete